MPKDAFYFPHDCNARHDPKILKMRSAYKIEGLGIYWAIIEMMREQENYLLPSDDDSISGYAEDLHCQSDLLTTFINDCVNKFKLFQRNGDHIWSESLLRRMSKFDSKSAKARQAAFTRWNIEAKEMQTHYVSNADAMQTQCKESIEDKIIEDKSTKEYTPKKKKYGEFLNVLLADEELKKLNDKYGKQTNDFIEQLSIYLKSKGKTYKDHYATILNWARRAGENGARQANPPRAIPRQYTKPEDL